MLRLSRLADYGVMVMAHVAADPVGVHNATDAAQATGLPGPTVAQIMAKLAKAGLLASLRGARGGYRLAAAPEEITVASIITALDGRNWAANAGLAVRNDGKLGQNVAVNFGMKRHSNMEKTAFL